MPHSLRRIAALFGENEFKELEAYAKKHKLSMYALCKAAIREFVKRHA